MLVDRRDDAGYLRRDFGDAEGTGSERALWWPPTKIAGRYLAPYLDRLDSETGVAQAERRESIGDIGPVRRRAVIVRARDVERQRTIALSSKD